MPDLPVGADVVLGVPVPDGQACGVGGAERGGLVDDRPDDGNVEDVRLELHEGLVEHHAAVDLERGEGHAGVGLRRLDDLAGLECGGLECRAGEVPLVDETGEPDDGSAGVGTPARSEQPGEGGDDVGATVVGDRGRQQLDFLRGVDDAEIVAQPLHERPRHRDRPFECVDGCRVTDPVADGGEQPVLALHRRRSGVEEQEVAGAVGVLGIAGRQARLPERRGLLVAQDARNGNARQVSPTAGGAVDVGRAADLGQQRHRDLHVGADLLVPLEGVQVHEHRAGRVGDVRGVDAAGHPAGEVPQDPRVHRPEAEVTRFGSGPDAVDVVEDPAKLRSREVGGEGKPGRLPIAVGSLVAGEFLAQFGGAGVLPDDGVVHRFARGAIPHDGRLALIGDADRGEVRMGEVTFGEGARHHLAGAAPDLARVVFDPPGLGEDLTVFLLRGGDHAAGVIEDHAAARRGALVDRGDVPGHWRPTLSAVSARSY
ncbi:hypothetical protein RHCRD62_110024 [Rhodococcus sp. RD6.2]|nr:hypothetical protein RHCRD62_110024 [Rhodococcus sp. RD6.2]